MSFPPGEGPITQDEAKDQVASEPDDDDVDPPAEPLTTTLPPDHDPEDTGD